MFPPMDHEELKLLDTIMEDASKVLTGQGDQLEQGRQLRQQSTEEQDSTCHLPHKLDLPTGRVGDPPGLDLDQGLGSSQQHQVECNEIKNETHTEYFPPMDLDTLKWFDGKMFDLQGATTLHQDHDVSNLRPGGLKLKKVFSFMGCCSLFLEETPQLRSRSNRRKCVRKRTLSS